MRRAKRKIDRKAKSFDTVQLSFFRIIAKIAAEVVAQEMKKTKPNFDKE